MHRYAAAHSSLQIAIDEVLHMHVGGNMHFVICVLAILIDRRFGMDRNYYHLLRQSDNAQLWS